MATHAARLTQDQNLNVHLDGSLVGGKKNGSKAQKKGGVFAGRKALNDISNSGKPSALQPSRKHNSLNVISIGEDLCVPKNSEKARVGGRKALGDLTNSAIPYGEHVLKKKKKKSKDKDVNLPSCIADERFLHNHQECIKSQTRALDMDYFMKTIGLNDISVLELSPWDRPRSIKSKVGQHENHATMFGMEELPELMTEPRQKKKLVDPVFGSPKSPYMQLKDYDFLNFKLKDSPMYPCKIYI